MHAGCQGSLRARAGKVCSRQSEATLCSQAFVNSKISNSFVRARHPRRFRDATCQLLKGVMPRQSALQLS